MFDKSLKILLIIIIFISVGCVSANYVMDMNSDIQLPDANTADYQTLIDDGVLESECCSVLFQVDESNTAYAFRRDANYEADIFIENFTIDNGFDGVIGCIKQYKTNDGYFLQSIITDNGWVVSVGGKSDGANNQIIENTAIDMLKTGNISLYNLTTIQKVLKKDQMGHFVIKAPNGTYAIVFSNKILDGNLKPGEYISVPNKDSYYRSGHINPSNPLKTVIKLACTDQFGLERRDITAYLINTGDNGTTANIYVSNDDGNSSFGYDSTVNMTDDIHIGDKVVKGSDIPVAPDYTDLGSFEIKHKNLSTLVRFFFIGF